MTWASDRRRALRAAALALGIGAVVVAVERDALAEPTPAERETARTLLLSGRDKRKAGRLEEALADFERAHAIMKVPTTGLDLGKAQEALGLLVEARATLLEVARLPAQDDEPGAFKRARREAKALAEQIAPRLATLRLTVTSGASVTIDGAEISSSAIGAPLKVNPGKHEIVAELDGAEKRTRVDLAEGGEASVELRLDAKPTRPREAKGEARAPEAPPSGTSSLVWIGLATAGVGALVGTTTGLLAFSEHDAIEQRCQGGRLCPPETHDDIARGETLGTVSTVAFVVAGVGVGVLVVGLLTPPSSARTGVRVTPGLGGLRATF